MVSQAGTNKKDEPNAQKTKYANLLRAASLLVPYRRFLVIVAVLTVLMGIIATLPPMITRALIDKVFTERRTNLFLLLGVCQVAVWLIYLGIALIQGYICVWLGQRFVLDIRNKLYSHLLNLSLRFFSKNSAGMLVNRLMGDTNTVQLVLTSQSVVTLCDLVVATFALTATILISWRMTLVIALLLIVFTLNFRMTIKKIITANKAMRSSYDRLSGGVQNRLVANIAVKTFGTEERENEAFHLQSSETIAYGKAQGIAGNTFSMNVGLIQAVGGTLVAFIGYGFVLSGDMTYGDVLAVAAYAAQLLWPAVRLSNLITNLQQVAVSTERLFEIFDQEPEIKNDENPIHFNKLHGEVEFREVHFHYEPGIEIIKGFSLHVSPGDTIAFIGPTGCGKSTLLNLIIRYYDITGGELLLDGHPINRLDLPSLRKQFGIVLQESHLFSTTVWENIRYSRPDATDEEVMAAARTAEIHDFIMTMEKGYDTLIGDNGVELSIGQKQRINIARAICANPAILIMDEATSSLDSDSEQAIQRAMEKVLKGRTSFIVAHRLSTIRNATKIILLDQGIIQESGTHDELMAIPNGRYRDLYLKHMGKGVIEE